jgi:hypothetical protein
MIYQRIWFDGVTVRLRFLEQLDGAKDAHEFECAETPTGAFKGSLAAFSPFVVKLLGLPLDWSDCDVRSLSLKREEKTNARGIQVTVMRKIADAKNRPVIITTPYLSEPPGDYQGDGQGYLDDITLKLIDEAEAQAELYRTGERGEQLKLGLSNENVAEFNENSAHAEVQSTRNPKGRKGKPPRQADTGVAIVANEAGEPLDEAGLRQLLLSVDRDVPVDAIGIWTSSERDAAQRWSEARQKEMIGELSTDLVPREPEAVIRYATLPLKADEWTGDPPPKARDVVTIAGRAD